VKRSIRDVSTSVSATALEATPHNTRNAPQAVKICHCKKQGKKRTGRAGQSIGMMAGRLRWLAVAAMVMAMAGAETPDAIASILSSAEGDTDGSCGAAEADESGGGAGCGCGAVKRDKVCCLTSCIPSASALRGLLCLLLQHRLHLVQHFSHSAS
jgi:hypothetical protein